MKGKPSKVEEILVKAVSAYFIEVRRTGAGYDSGRPHSEIITQAKTELRKLALGAKPKEKDESCSLNDDLGYHAKICWDECWAKINYNKGIADFEENLKEVFGE